MAPPKEPKEAAVAIKGLAPSVTDAMLRQLYGICGRVLRVKMDGLGGAHVVFSSNKSAERAVKATQATELEGQKIDVQVVRQFSDSNRPCRGFQEGICRKGDACKYLHIGDATAAAVTSTPNAAPKAPPKVKTSSTAAPPTQTSQPQAATAMDPSAIPASLICRFFARGHCANGTSCRFAHVLGVAPPQPPPSSIPAQCSFFAVGRCTRGEQCQFLHGPAPESPAAPAVEAPSTKPAVTPKSVAPKPVVSKPVPATTQKAKKQKPERAPTKQAPPPVKTPAVSDDRVCIECEQSGTATLRCDACDGALYCEDCDAMVHRPKVMRGHERSTLPPVVVKASRPLCNECETEEAVNKCDDCDTTYCAACDASVHRFKSLRNHQRSPIDDEETDARVPTLPSQPKQETASMKKSTKTTTPRVTAEPTPIVTKAVDTYVDSVPQYDLPSESDSSDDEEEEEEETGAAAAMKAATRTVISLPSVDSSSEEEEDDEEEATPALSTTRAAAYVESVPKYELSSESEDEDSDDDDDDKAPVPLSKPSPAKTAAQLPPPVSPTKLYVRLPADVSSESSDDDDFDDERPVMPATSAGATTEKKTSLPSLDISSESSSDDEAERPQTTTPVARTSTTASKRKASSSSSSSSSSDSDDSDDDDEPASKQPRREEPPKTTKRSAPASSGHSNGKAGGISEGNTHSVVRKIEAYASSDRSDVLHLDPNLNGFERLLAHDCAERLGLRHVSVGEGLERHITISRHDGDKRAALKRSAAADATGRAKKAKHTSKQ